MRSYITATCGERRDDPLLQVENGRRVFVPLVPPSGLRWHIPSLLYTPFQTCHDNCCLLFPIYKEKTSREVGADGSHVTGSCMDGIAFSMTTVKWAACWHSKRQRTTNTNQSSLLPCFHPVSQCYNRPLPWHAIIPVMNQGHWSNWRERQELGSAPYFCPPFAAVATFTTKKNTVLHCYVWLKARFRWPAGTHRFMSVRTRLPHLPPRPTWKHISAPLCPLET